MVKDLGGNLIEIGTMSTEEVILNRSYIGYTGALSLIEKVFTKSVGG